MIQLLILLGALILHPYWHVPKAARYVELVPTETGSDLVCQECGEIVYRWISKPTLTDIVDAAKRHKRHSK